jgi:hypothetical protein
VKSPIPPFPGDRKPGHPLPELPLSDSSSLRCENQRNVEELIDWLDQGMDGVRESQLISLEALFLNSQLFQCDTPTQSDAVHHSIQPIDQFLDVALSFASERRGITQRQFREGMPRFVIAGEKAGIVFSPSIPTATPAR